MIQKGLFTQIGMIVLSIVIVFTYVKPEFVKIGEMQDEISVYNEEIRKVDSVNSQLATLKSKMDSTSQENKRRLQIYMPDSIDELNVMRDIGIIYTLAGFKNAIVKYDGFGSKSGSTKKSSQLKDSVYSVEVEGDYDKLKILFDLLEMNHYPIEMIELDVTRSEETGLLSIASSFVTHSFQLPEVNNVTKF